MPFELRVYADKGWAWKVKVSMALKKSVFHKTDSTSESCVCVCVCVCVRFTTRVPNTQAMKQEWSVAC